MSYPVYYVEESDTLPHLFDTFDGGTGASITMTGLAVTDIEIYKDGGTTQRASDSGYTLLDTDGIDFDGTTGIHGFSIDLSDNTDAGFYAVGSWYHVVVASITIDGQTVNFVACAFRIVSATRGMAGTALPDAAADAAGGVPISDAGGLDMDTFLGRIDATLTARTLASASYFDPAADTVANVTTVASVSGSVGSVTGAVGSVTAGVSLAAGAITDASLAGNMEIVFETDFATNYNTTRNAWATNVQDFVGTSAADPFNGQVVAASVTGAVGSVTAGVTLSNGAITDASLAGNMEIVFETDFATNYNTTRNAWATNAQDFVGTTGADPFNAQVVAASVTGHTAQTGDTYALANGASGFVAIDTVVDAIKVVTDALGATAAGNLAKSAGNAGIISGTVDTATNGHTPTTTEFQADDITEATADHYIGRIVIWLTGALTGQATDITDYAAVGGIGQFTVTALTEAPANNDTFIIV